MRLPVLLLLACVLSGCATTPQKTAAPKASDPINPATPEQLETAKQRIHLLRPDMTDEQVFATLGLVGCYGHCFADAGGPFSHFWVSYTLRNGRDLHIVRNVTGAHESTLRSVSVDGVIWKPDERY
jgi:uncharacterized protein YceK